MKTNADPLWHDANRSSSARADAALTFGRFRVLLRQRQLLADGVPVELGTRAFDLLLVLLEADGSLLSKEELLSRVWPGIVVSEENLKVQMSALRKALGADRDVILTEFGRGYRFTGVLRSNSVSGACQRPTRKAAIWSDLVSTELSAIAPVQFQFELSRQGRRSKLAAMVMPSQPKQLKDFAYQCGRRDCEYRRLKD